jgi:hypothetical protein
MGRWDWGFWQEHLPRDIFPFHFLYFHAGCTSADSSARRLVRNLFRP